MKIKLPEKVTPILEKITPIVKKLSGENRYYVFIGILVVIFFLDYFLLMNPQLASLQKINPEIKIVSDKINKTKEDLKQLTVFRRDLIQLSKKFEEANFKIKSRDEISAILEYIALVASQTGVKIDQIMPDTLELELLTENNQRKYFNLPIYMEARSSYHNFGRFLSKISQNDVSLGVGTFSIVTTSDRRYHAVKLTFKVTVFEDIKS